MKKPDANMKRYLTHLTDAAMQCAGDPLPDPAVERRFRAWSAALKTVVRYHLATAGWSVEEFHYDPDCDGAQVFSFHYDGRVELAGGDALFVSTRMRFDARKPLDAELARLDEEAAFYRTCVNRMRS